MTEKSGNDITVLLRSALRRLPGPVSIVTTHDPAGGGPAGMVASAVIPVSMEPPSMLVAVNRQSSCHACIENAGRFCINLLGTEQRELVAPFSTASLRQSRFETGGWEFADNIPFLSGAIANLFCKVENTLVHGSHELFIGDVYEVRLADGSEADPLGWMEGGFARFGSLD
ncbi:MAG: flavin reductase [Sphingomonadaceae bacterium]|nr:flavin reductase [Sphingomonadaceae bacterium]MCP5383212.1 flavin reductase [Altererythrobacter sp.]MCP5393389.1 flavin reductase [Sphingomonadaceae bacterium]